MVPIAQIERPAAGGDDLAGVLAGEGLEGGCCEKWVGGADGGEAPCEEHDGAGAALGEKEGNDGVRGGEGLVGAAVEDHLRAHVKM